MDYKTLANQLGNPEGELGIAVGKQMHKSNIGMILTAFQLLTINHNDHVLEIGHGSCAHLNEIMSTNRDFHYYGLELSQTMCEEAKKINQNVLDKADFYLFDGQKFDFADATFDKIVTINTIYFWRDPDFFIQEIYRVLKPHGKLCITFANKSFMKNLAFVDEGFQLYDPEEVVRMGSNNNFTNYVIESKREKIINNAGESVEREYTAVLFTK